MVSQTIDERIRHITAIIIDQPLEEPFITVDYDTFEYIKESGEVKFKAQIIHTGSICEDFKVVFPFYLIRGGDDKEIARWRQSYIEKVVKSIDWKRVVEVKTDLNVSTRNGISFHTASISEMPKPVDFEKPLSTNLSFSKLQLIQYLQNADIPDDAECRLQFDDGKFYLCLYWSEKGGVYGHRIVDFDLESKKLVDDVWNYMDQN